jgi:hypothetical protein
MQRHTRDTHPLKSNKVRLEGPCKLCEAAGLLDVDKGEYGVHNAVWHRKFLESGNVLTDGETVINKNGLPWARQAKETRFQLRIKERSQSALQPGSPNQPQGP